MAKRLTILLVALLALGFVVAGCGDDDDDTASDTTTATTEQTTTQDTTEDAGGGAAASGIADSPQVKAAIENCKARADADPQLSNEAKKKVGEVCEEVGTGDADAAAKATREACVIIVSDTIKQEGPRKDAALAACKQSTTTP